MSTTLIVAEKPSAAQKIAYALGKTEVKREGKVHYFHTKVNGEELIVVPAVGHLFGLAPKVRGKYPIFDLEWKPIWEVSKKAAFSKPYAKLIEKLAKSADKFIIACDFDIEGEVIGLNVLRYLCHQKDAKRMKFSTLTAPDLREAYDNVLPSIAWGQAEAGEARHYLDWIWGVNLSQAAMAALMEQGIRKTLSIGRVQGPALALLAKRELDIRKFVPKPYWQISILLDTKPRIEAWHHTEVFWSEGEAKKIFEKIKDKPTKLVEVTTVEETLLPPTPFDLTTLQMEAWRNFKLTPKMTQQIAQDLYTAALISYPRTSSQKLPPTINYKKILLNLSKQKAYKIATEYLLQKTLKPRQGAKTDPAHPAIYPTGETPKALNSRQKAIYDLIVKRFLAVFGEPAIKETTKMTFEIENEHFHFSGSKIIKEGWRELYKPYVESVEDEVPSLLKGEIVQQKSKLHNKKTTPPKRYSPASIIKELEKRNLGTKATRSQILDTLYQRGYISGTSIEVTSLGLKMVEAFGKYAPDILSERLTRHFEEDMELIRERKKSSAEVFTEARKVLISLLNQFNLHRKQIGEELAIAVTEARKAESVLMKCPKCGKGDFKIIISQKSGKRFLACNKYPSCKTAWPLPQQGLLKIMQQKHTCGTPYIQIIKKGCKPWKLCPNPTCSEKSQQENTCANAKN